jgi:hypothetical protein
MIINKETARVKYSGFSMDPERGYSNYYSGSKIISAAVAASDIYELQNSLLTSGVGNPGANDYISEIKKWQDSQFWDRIGEPIRLNPDRFMFLRSRSASTEEGYGANRNRDAFQAQDLRERFMSFIGAQSFVDHDNKDWSKLLGGVKDVVYIETPEVYKDAGWSESLSMVDLHQMNRLYRGLAPMILAGIVTDVSMGCVTNYSICSRCGAKITARSSCGHLKNKFERLKQGGLAPDIYELVKEFAFFELSFITAGGLTGHRGGGADPNAKIQQKYASILAHPEKGVHYDGSFGIDENDTYSQSQIEFLMRTQSQLDNISKKYECTQSGNDGVVEIIQSGVAKVAYFFLHQLPVDSPYPHLAALASNIKTASALTDQQKEKYHYGRAYNILEHIKYYSSSSNNIRDLIEKVAFDPSVDWSSGNFLQTKLSRPPLQTSTTEGPIEMDLIGLPKTLDVEISDNIKKIDKQNLLGLINLKDTQEISVDINNEENSIQWTPDGWEINKPMSEEELLNSKTDEHSPNDLIGTLDNIFGEDVWNQNQKPQGTISTGEKINSPIPGEENGSPNAPANASPIIPFGGGPMPPG